MPEPSDSDSVPSSRVDPISSAAVAANSEAGSKESSDAQESSLAGLQAPRKVSERESPSSCGTFGGNFCTISPQIC